MFLSLCFKLWQALVGGWPHVLFFSLKNFSWQDFQPFVDSFQRLPPSQHAWPFASFSANFNSCASQTPTKWVTLISCWSLHWLPSLVCTATCQDLPFLSYYHSCILFLICKTLNGSVSTFIFPNLHPRSWIILSLADPKPCHFIWKASGILFPSHIFSRGSPVLYRFQPLQTQNSS